MVAREGEIKRAGSVALWVVATLLTLVILVYQRRTGPTYPIDVRETVGPATLTGRLPRTHPGEGGAEIALKASGGAVDGRVQWRRFPTSDPWQETPMRGEDGRLRAELPHQPRAGKLEYRVELSCDGRTISLPKQGAAVIRFRGDVPAWIVIGHVVAMFVGLLFGLRIALAAVFNEPRPMRLAAWLVGASALGGFVLGPVMQLYSFGALWTGWPLGPDLTDTKTLATVVVWVIAWWVAAKKPRWARIAAFVGTAAMLGAYLVPHSLRGSQLDWSTEPPVDAASVR